MENAAGILSRVLPAAVIDDTVLDAIVLSACADGMDKTELDALTRMARELPSLAGKDEATVAERVQESFARVERDGLEGRLKALAETPMDDATRHRIFCAAAVIQYADGHVTNEENEFLLDLADVLGLDETAVREIVLEIERSLASSV